MPGRDDVTRVRVTAVAVDDERIEFSLSDGRVISAPLTWSRRLVAASAAERADYSISPSGTVVEWPSIDEHIGLWSMLRVPEEVVLEAAGFDRASGPVSA
jgi:Protein of unknown function (DUF3532).